MNQPQPEINGIAALKNRAVDSLRNPSYRFYLSGSLCQFAALSMQIITMPLLMYRLTGSSAMLGIMALVGASPMIIFSLLGGAIADRVPKKQIIIIGLLASAVVSAGIGMSLSAGYINADTPGSWWILIASALMMGTVMGLMMPALQAAVAEIVTREKLMNAVALNTMGMNTLNMVAPGIAGFMIDALGFDAVYYTMAGLYILGAVFISFVPLIQKTATAGSHILGEIREGFGYILKDRLIFIVLTFSLAATVLSMPYQQLLPIYVDDILKVGATGMGVIMSVSGGGALAGSIVLASLPNKRRGLMLLASGLVSGVALIVFSFSSTWILSLTFIVFIGLGQTFRMTIGSTLLQTYAAPDYRGRVMSIFSMQWGLMSICTFVAGVVAEVLPVQWILGVLAMLLVVVSTLSIIFLPGTRRLD